MLKTFRIVGLLEGSSFLLLLGVAMPLKYIAGNPLAVKYLGWAHGVLFMAYVAVAFAAADALNWSVKQRFGSLVAAVMPFGPFVFDKIVLQKTAD
jgi:integral membrane protein